MRFNPLQNHPLTAAMSRAVSDELTSSIDARYMRLQKKKRTENKKDFFFDYNSEDWIDSFK